ncbi:hypothetical protein HK102_006611, partial [Quaeritorhiza haematococci]
WYPYEKGDESAKFTIVMEFGEEAVARRAGGAGGAKGASSRKGDSDERGVKG